MMFEPLQKALGLNGSMVDYEYPEEKVAAAMQDVPVVA